MSTNRDALSQFSGEKFSRRIVYPMASLIVLAIALVVAFVMMSAQQQNSLALEDSTQLAKTALEVKEREIGRNLKDYAVWEDVYNNLHLDLNVDWASTDGNIGANIYTGLGYEMAFVIAPNGKTVYSVVNGEPGDTDAFSLIPSGLSALLRKGIAETAPQVGLLRARGDILLVAATSILPPSVSASQFPPTTRSAIVFVKKLDQKFLSRISQEYLLKDLRISDADDMISGAAIPLIAPDETFLGEITWNPSKPGYQLLRFLLPPLTICLVLLAVFAVVVVRNARRSTKAIETSARTIQAYSRTLEESEARFRDVAEASSDWIWECDTELRLVYFSVRFTEMTGLAAASVLGKTLEQFFSSDTETQDWQRLLHPSGLEDSFRDLRCCYRDAEGATRICRLAGRPILDANNGVIGYRGTATDITQEVAAHARANHLALHDALTGLPNRILFRERLDEALTSHEFETSRLAVLCLDLDHFKEVNDTLGHGAGDILLTELGERLRSCILPSDTVARLGGDEFAIVQMGVNQPLEAGALARRIIEVVKAPFQIDGQELHVGVSIGVSFPSDDCESAETLLKNADIALYRAKQSGRGTVCLFERQMDLELQARKALEFDLRQALAKDQFEIFYQPLVELNGGRITAVEALLRWRHPDHGLVSPMEFIPLAEETGLILGIGEWVIRTACAQVRAWPGLRVAVNLSPVQFKHRELVETVRQALADTGLEPDRLELEITESVLLHDTPAALNVLTALKELGVLIAMDDFGTGYSSLGYLNSFPFDKLKIDKSFISDLNDKQKSNAIVRSVISLGQSLNMTTTAEGVETVEQADFLLREGCEQVQGYYFGRPVPASEFDHLIDNWNAWEPTRTTPQAA